MSKRRCWDCRWAERIGETKNGRPTSLARVACHWPIPELPPLPDCLEQADVLLRYAIRVCMGPHDGEQCPTFEPKEGGQ